MFILELLYLTLPAFVANMMPVFAARLAVLPSLAKPMDAGRTWRGKRILGENKTWRGTIAAVFGSTVVVLVQFYEGFPLTIETVVYDSVALAIAFGVLVGLLVIVGDGIGSFIKRQFNFKSGQPCIPLDQIDYIVVFIIGTLPFISWTVEGAVALVLVTFFLNLGTNALGYVAGIKNTYW